MTIRLTMLTAALAISGCADPEPAAPVVTVEVRAVYEKPVFDGEAATFDHEVIPGVMDAMRMDLPVASPDLLTGLAPGDKVQLTLQTEPRIRVVAVGALPDTTALALAPR